MVVVHAAPGVANNYTTIRSRACFYWRAPSRPRPTKTDGYQATLLWATLGIYSSSDINVSRILAESANLKKTKKGLKK